MNENDSWEDITPKDALSDETFDEIASAVENLADEELRAAPVSQEPETVDSDFEAVSSAVEDLMESEFSDSVYPPEEEAFTGSTPISTPDDQPESQTPDVSATPEYIPADSNPDFQELPEPEPSVSEPQAQSPAHNRPAHKGRPRRKKGAGLLGIPQLVAAVIWLLIIVAIGVSLGRVMWTCAADVLAFGRENKEVVISITSDDTLDTIADKLQESGLIRYRDLFLLYADLAKVEEKGKITTGTFTLNTVYDYMALVNAMSPSSGSREVIEDVLIPEGYSCRQIFSLLEEKGICTVKELEEYAATGEFSDYWFLEGVERGDKYCLEGFLFPDTYDFYKNSTPREALGKMLSGFNYRFTEEIYNQLPALNERLSEMMRKNGCTEEYIAANQLDLRKLLTVASLIEEETSGSKESSRIASVIYNRLTQDQAHERYLNIDAAIFYALGEHKESLTSEDLQIDSPYNTYTHPGLTPGPITNPGLDSIQAALTPESTSYYYYVLDPSTGTHIFAQTYEEHQANVNKVKEQVVTDDE